MSTLLDVENLSVEFMTHKGVLRAVNNVSFSLEKGETLCVVGESGCGKSLTSLSIVDLLPATARRSVGRLAFAGEDLSAGKRSGIAALRGRRISMIFQDPMKSLNPVLTIGDQMADGYLHHMKGTRRAAVARARDLLETVGVPEPDLRLTQYPHQLSGGLRQRVMIAMALMCEPELLIADEPTTALDVTVQIQVLALLKRLQRELGLTMILITHDFGVVARMADRVAVMYAGEIVEEGTSEEIFTRPSHPYTQGLLRCLPARGVTQLGTIPGVVPSLIGASDGCGFASRCAFATETCKTKNQAFARLSETHAYRCNLSAEKTLENAEGVRR